MNILREILIDQVKILKYRLFLNPIKIYVIEKSIKLLEYISYFNKNYKLLYIEKILIQYQYHQKYKGIQLYYSQSSILFYKNYKFFITC